MGYKLFETLLNSEGLRPSGRFQKLPHHPESNKESPRADILLRVVEHPDEGAVELWVLELRAGVHADDPDDGVRVAQELGHVAALPAAREALVERFDIELFPDFSAK